MVRIENGPYEYGIVALVFGLRAAELEPNPSNQALARAVSKAFDEVLEVTKKRPIVSSQWEITKGLRRDMNIIPDLSVELHADGSYLDTKDVWGETEELFAEQEVNRVVVIAQSRRSR